MAVKASATITLNFMVDIQAAYRYYKLVSSTAATPSVPTAHPPEGWSDSEPSYTSGSTNTLYFVDLTVFTNGSYLYSPVSKSSSYEAAKEAYNKASAAQDTADTVAGNFRRVVKIDDEGLHVGDTLANGEVLIDSDSVNIVFNGSRYSKLARNYVQFGNYQLRRSSDGGLVFKLE